MGKRNKYMKKILLNLEDKKAFEKHWGKKCKEYAPLCATCVAWLSFESLRDLYLITDSLHFNKKVE